MISILVSYRSNGRGGTLCRPALSHILLPLQPHHQRGHIRRAVPHKTVFYGDPWI